MNLEQSSTLEGHGKFDTGWLGFTESEQLVRVLKLSVGVLVTRTKCGEFWAEGFDDATALLGAVPVATSEFDSAKRHLANAIVYCHQNELGAATFELRAVRGKLPRL